MTLTLYRRSLLVLIVALLSFAAAQDAGASCNDNAGCDKGSFCRKASEDCDGAGKCEVMPEVCTEEYNPQCGCDGRTHDNPCYARLLGANVASAGECKDGGGADAQGGCTANTDCEKGSFCQKASEDCDGTGKCEVMPDFCTEEYNPQCGCDGTTHDNPCYARLAGTNVASAGECKDDGGADVTGASCKVNKDCDKGSFCQKAPEDCDGAGTCVAKPPVCTKQFDPVCGCDGATHANTCVGKEAGANVASYGECAAGTAEVAGATEEDAGAETETAETGTGMDTNAAATTTAATTAAATATAATTLTADGTAATTTAATTASPDPDPDTTPSSGRRATPLLSSMGAGAAVAFALGLVR